MTTEISAVGWLIDNILIPLNLNESCQCLMHAHVQLFKDPEVSKCDQGKVAIHPIALVSKATTSCEKSLFRRIIKSLWTLRLASRLQGSWTLHSPSLTLFFLKLLQTEEGRWRRWHTKAERLKSCSLFSHGNLRSLHAELEILEEVFFLRIVEVLLERKLSEKRKQIMRSEKTKNLAINRSCADQQERHDSLNIIPNGVYVFFITYTHTHTHTRMRAHAHTHTHARAHTCRTGNPSNSWKTGLQGSACWWLSNFLKETL